MDDPDPCMTLGLGVFFCKFFYLFLFLLFSNTVLLFTPLFMIKITWKILQIFVHVFVNFCDVFMHFVYLKSWWKMLVYILASFLVFYAKFMENCLVLLQVLDNCWWYMSLEFLCIYCYCLYLVLTACVGIFLNCLVYKSCL
jgi:hypothetical protein